MLRGSCGEKKKLAASPEENLFIVGNINLLDLHSLKLLQSSATLRALHHGYFNKPTSTTWAHKLFPPVGYHKKALYFGNLSQGWYKLGSRACSRNKRDRNLSQ